MADAVVSVALASCAVSVLAPQEQLDELKRRVNAVKAKPLTRWTVGDIAAWIDVGVGLPQYARRLAAAMRSDASSGIPPATVLCGLDERALAAKVGRCLGLLRPRQPSESRLCIFELGLLWSLS